jgi:hypothetical protein
MKLSFSPLPHTAAFGMALAVQAIDENEILLK